MKKGTAIANEYWFVLASKTLSWYENKDENDRIFTIPLDGLKIRDEQDTIVLFNPDGRNVYQDLTQMELSCKNPDEIRSWRDSFSRVFGNVSLSFVHSHIFWTSVHFIYQLISLLIWHLHLSNAGGKNKAEKRKKR